MSTDVKVLVQGVWLGSRFRLVEESDGSYQAECSYGSHADPSWQRPNTLSGAGTTIHSCIKALVEQRNAALEQLNTQRRVCVCLGCGFVEMNCFDRAEFDECGVLQCGTCGGDIWFLDQPMDKLGLALGTLNSEVTTLQRDLDEQDGVVSVGLKGRVESLENELAQKKLDHENACKCIAAMHAAAMGEVCGPVLGAVEDVAELRRKYELIRDQGWKLHEAIETFSDEDCWDDADWPKYLHDAIERFGEGTEKSDDSDRSDVSDAA